MPHIPHSTFEDGYCEIQMTSYIWMHYLFHCILMQTRLVVPSLFIVSNSRKYFVQLSIFSFIQFMGVLADLNSSKLSWSADWSLHDFKNIIDVPADLSILKISLVCWPIFIFQKYHWRAGLCLHFKNIFDVQADLFISKILFVCGSILIF